MSAIVEHKRLVPSKPGMSGKVVTMPLLRRVRPPYASNAGPLTASSQATQGEGSQVSGDSHQELRCPMRGDTNDAAGRTQSGSGKEKENH